MFTRKLFIIIFSLLLIPLCAFLIGQQPGNLSQEPDNLSQDSSKFVQLPDTLDLVFVGDLMGHMPQVNAAKYDGGDSSYNYRKAFKEVKDYFNLFDIRVGNLEVTFAGEPYSGYPRFSSPDQYGEDIKDVGVDVLLLANNHILDGAQKGFERTLSTVDRLQFQRVGGFYNQAEKDSIYPLILDKHGIKLSILNYTYGTNGFTPKHPNIVNYIDTALIRKDVLRSRELGAELVIACVHWGVEYARREHISQSQVAKFMVQSGIDLIVGGHPHVVQPIKWLPAKNESDSVAVAYSLGNFFSNQRDRYKNGGIALQVQIIKRDSLAKIEQVSYEPFWVRKYPVNGRNKYRIIRANHFNPDSNIYDHPFTAEEIRQIKEFRADCLSLIGF